jgi:hypothetical protein
MDVVFLFVDEEIQKGDIATYQIKKKWE